MHVVLPDTRKGGYYDQAGNEGHGGSNGQGSRCHLSPRQSTALAKNMTRGAAENSIVEANRHKNILI